ncbi:MAG TPA: energy transducer TonB [Longimicrobiaceae bacterium]|nr:energy transducer TonB [Longimicrobiaceae bacterium]
MAFDANGRISRLHPIDYWLPQGQVDAFTSLLRQHLRPRVSGPGTVRLLLQPGGTAAYQIGYSERCPPESGTRFSLIAPAATQLQKAQPVRVRMHVDAQGRVQGTQVLTGSGDTEVDRWVAQTLQQREFSPGLIDGVAVAMDHEETVTVRVRQ